MTSPTPVPRRRPPEQRAIILTAWTDEQDMHNFHSLRQRFFPKQRHFVSAHVTLFHHLPGDRRRLVLDTIRDHVRDFTHDALDSESGMARVGVTGVFRMQRGVAYRLAPRFLRDVRAPLRATFAPYLRPQDLHPWRNPHITVQNKVSPADAERLERHLRARFRPCSIRVYGLQAWRYDYGPWTLLERFPFASATSEDPA